MDKNIFKVERDEYAGLIGEMKVDCFDMEKDYQENDTYIRLRSKKTGKLITERIIHNDSEEEYYIFELPDDDERQAPKRIRQYKLETKEEVQAFFDILNKLQKKENDGTVS